MILCAAGARGTILDKVQTGRPEAAGSGLVERDGEYHALAEPDQLNKTAGLVPVVGEPGGLCCSRSADWKSLPLKNAYDQLRTLEKRHAAPFPP
jgi:hypothetical protein